VGSAEQGDCSGFKGSYRRCCCRCNPPTTKHDRFWIDGLRPHSPDMGRQGFSLTLMHTPAGPFIGLGRSFTRSLWILRLHKLLSESCTFICSCSPPNQTIKQKAWPCRAIRRTLNRVLLKPPQCYLTGSAVMRSLATSFWSSVNPES